MNTQDNFMIEKRMEDLLARLPGEWQYLIQEKVIIVRKTDSRRFVLNIPIDASTKEIFKDDRLWEECCQHLVETLRMSMHHAEIVTRPMNMETFEELRDHLVIKPVNVSDDKVVNDLVIHEIHGDIAFCVFVEEGMWKEHYAGFRITHQTAANWPISEEELLQIAKENTLRRYPPQIMNIELPEDGSNIILRAVSEDDTRTDYQLLNVNMSGWIYGSIGVFDPHTQERLCRMMGGSYMVSLFDISMAAVHRLHDNVYEDISASIEAVSHMPGYMLTDSIYIYEADSGKFRLYEPN